MNRYGKRALTLSATLVVMALWSVAPVAHAQPVASDVVTVGTVVTLATTVDVPVYIRDVSGSPLGLDQPSGSRIQSYSIKVSYAPASAVQSITFTRAGITTALTPTSEFHPTSAGAISLIDTFDESTDLIPFTLNGAPSGNQVGHLAVTLTPGTVPGTVITLTLDPTLTQLTDQGGDAATKESTGGANLTLVNGSITLIQDIPALSTYMLLLLAVSLALVAMRLRF